MFIVFALVRSVLSHNMTNPFQFGLNAVYNCSFSSKTKLVPHLYIPALPIRFDWLSESEETSVLAE